MFVQFRATYPTGQLISELVTIHNGKFVVRTLVQVDGVTVATGLAAADTVESAEDAARARSLAFLGLNPSTSVSEKTSPTTLATVSSSDSSFSSEPFSIPQKSISVNSKPPLPPVSAPAPEVMGQGYSPTAPSFSPEPKQFDSDAWLGSSYSDPGSETLGESKSLETTPLISGDPMTIAGLNEPTDHSELIAQIDVLLKRLKWTKDQEAEYLTQAYGKRSQDLLPIEELQDFLEYLEIFGKTTEHIKRIGWGTKQGREYLELTYSKMSRHHLNKEELLDFLNYLETQ